MANVAQTGELFPPNLLDEIRSRFLYVQSDPFSGYRIFFDSASGSLRLRSVLYEHIRVDHERCFANGKAHINSLEGFWSYATIIVVKKFCLST